MITVENKVRIYKPENENEPALLVCSHWNDPQMVVLKINGKEITVVARDLEAAIQNSKNSCRH